MAPAPTAVVDARYCAPHSTAFKVNELLFGILVVEDARDVKVMRVEGVPFFSSRHRYRYLLVDVSAARSRPVLTLERSPPLFGSGAQRWEAYKGNSQWRSNLLFVAVEVEGSSWFNRADIHVHLAGRGERDPDFKVAAAGLSGSYYTVSHGGRIVAQIRRRIALFVDCYSVSVNAGVDHAFILALTAILADRILDDIR